VVKQISIICGMFLIATSLGNYEYVFKGFLSIGWGLRFQFHYTLLF